MSVPTNWLGNAVGGLLGQQTTAPWPQWAQQYQGLQLQQQPQMVLHHAKNANNFKNLTAYLRALMACEEHCECKWCAASELERKMAIVLFLKPEADEEE